MQGRQMVLNPLDVLVLLKIVTYGHQPWVQVQLAEGLGISQSEVSKSLVRVKYAGLLDSSGKKVMKTAFLEFLQYGLRYVFPQKPGPVVRGVPTSHSAAPLNDLIQSNEDFVWPSARGTVRGQSIIPLFPSVPDAALKDEKLYALLALTDAMRVGRARERELAIEELKKRFANAE